ncbi:nuclease-related domain-containing protein [Nitrobacter hamburgensis]|uniref:nuclease-related domain-containing protein n=1 Tax=Nitrobacter hamburgensis TaxID=912 RepID=UPI0002F1F55B|nr:nuclease-related domain-containing protein [Nitrobacter hamburgensis]
MKKGTGQSAVPQKQPPRLKEKLVKQVLKTFAWGTLKQHLSTFQLNDDNLSELLGHIRHSTDFLLKRPDQAREDARAAFTEGLRSYLAEHAGPDAAAGLGDLIAVLQRIEAGYREILRTQQATVAAKLLPETQVSAALSRAAYSYHELMEAFNSSVKRRKELTLQSFRIMRSDGSSYSPDGVLAGIVDVAAMTLLLHGHQNNWFDPQKFLVLPRLTEVTEDEVYKAGLTELLAASWRQWERVDQRCRYFDGEIKVFTGDAIPSWAPQGTETAIEYGHISKDEFFDYLANERLNDRLIQTFQEMSLQTNMQTQASGIAAPLPLPPGTFVSPQEAHSGVSLSEILGYSIVDDHERPCGLRLLEWIRGYATLQCLADERYSQHGESGIYFSIPREDLIDLLDRVGLKDGTAEIFIDQASLRMSSRDLFDQPLIRIEDGSLLVFGPGLLNSDPARLTLSAIGNEGEQLGRKGNAFEAETLRFFQDQGYAAKAFKFKHEGEEYQYDAIVPWDDHIFVLECKNRTLSGHNPVAAYYFVMEIASAVKQVTRLANALVEHASLVLERFGIDVANKTVVPCVVNSLPYAMKGDLDGVYVTDASGLRRFFQERNFHIVRPHHLKTKNATILHRTSMKSLWAGEKPTTADLMSYLRDPLALQLGIGHGKEAGHVFGLGERTVVAVTDLVQEEMTTASIAKLFSVDEKWVRHEAKAVAAGIRKATKKHEKRSVRDADRAWRTSRQRRR